MEQLKLNVDTIAKDLSSCIAFTKFSSKREATVERFAIYDDKTFLLSNDCLYLCLGDDFPPCKRIQNGTGIVCLNSNRPCNDAACDRCDLIVVKNIEDSSLVNKVANLFSRYQRLSHIIEIASRKDSGLQEIMDAGEELIGAPLCLLDVKQNIIAHSNHKALFGNPLIASRKDSGLQEIMDAGEELIGAPLCLLDVKQNIIAHSNHKALFGNPLWETIVRDDKPTRCEIVDACEQESSPDGLELKNTAISALGVSGYSLLSRCLFRKGKPCASLWALATEPDRLFNPAEFKLFAWIARCLDVWAEETKLLQSERGLRTERFLLDVVEGVLSDATGIEAAAQKVRFDLKADNEYQLCLIRSNNPLTHIEASIEMMREIENCSPNTICAMENHTIIALFTLRDSFELPEKQIHFLQSLCEGRGYDAVLSNAYYNLQDTPRVVSQASDCFQLAKPAGKRGQLIFYRDHMAQQLMHFVMSEMPGETLLHPMVRKLQSYDQQNDTDLLETFKVYLNNRCNAAETSSQLHMHRNTLLNRVKRIEEILGQSSFDSLLETFKVYLNNRCNAAETSSQLHMHRNTLLNRVKRIEEILGQSSFDSWTLRRALLLSIDYLYLEEGRQI